MFETSKSIDALGRRSRHAPPRSAGKAIRLVPADYLLFEYLDDHGILPTSYLYEAVKHLRGDYGYHQDRLRDLRNEANTQHGGRYLRRSKQQRKTFHRDRQPLCYANTKFARLALGTSGCWLYPPRNDQDAHRMMVGTITCSLRLVAPEFGIRFVPMREIVGSDRCPVDTRSASSPLAISACGGTLVPDDVFGLEYPTEPRTYRFFALEADRSTETLGRVRHKLRCYLELQRTRLHTAHWGLPNLLVMFVTTRPQRMQNVMEMLGELSKDDAEVRRRFLFTCKPQFDFEEEWIVPPVMTELVAYPWQRAGLTRLNVGTPS